MLKINTQNTSGLCKRFLEFGKEVVTFVKG